MAVTAGKKKGPAGPHEDRLRRAIGLGLRPSSSSVHDGRYKLWWNTDAEVQGQAVRAIQAFLNASNSKLLSLDRYLLDDIISALEGLLKAESEQVYTVAADVTAALINVGQTSVIGSRIQGLCASLVHLLSSTRRSIIVSCATALCTIIIDAPRLRTYISMSVLWEVFKEGDILNILMTRLEKHESIDGESASLYVAQANLLTAMMDQWTSTRFGVGSSPQFRKSIFLQCKSSNEAVCCAALRLCAALALCGGVALLQVQDIEELTSCLVTSTSPFKRAAVRSEAFRLLYILSRLSNLSTVVCESFSDSIMMNITDAIVKGHNAFKSKWPPDAKNLVLEASQAAQGLIYSSGKHHRSLWRAGFIDAICTLLLAMYTGGLLVKSKSTNYDPVIGPVLWDTLSWISMNASTSGEGNRMRSKQQEALVTKTVDFACAFVLKVVDRRGIRTESMHPQEYGYYGGVEGVSICQFVLFILFSPSRYLESAARHSFQRMLQEHGFDWLPFFVSKLSLTLGSGAASENMNTLMSLIATCCLSKLVECHDQLHRNGVLDILMEAINTRTFLSKKDPTSVSAIHCFRVPVDKKVCCFDRHEAWEGNDLLLFFSLWAFARLAQGSDMAETIRSSLKMRMWRRGEGADFSNEDSGSCFLVLASSTNVAAGVRWWALSCLACCGAYGFPSVRNQTWKLFDNELFSDIKLVFGNGNHFNAHKVLLATKCPALLAREEAPMQSPQVLGQGVEVRYQAHINLSMRIHEPPMRALLEFVYGGFVLVGEDLVPELKLLAKRCGVDALYNLLQGNIPTWGSIPNSSDLTPALRSIGCRFSDIFLEDKEHSCVGCIAAEGDRGHQHAHRAVLSCQCSYFEGLFRSGMIDSSFKVVKVPLHVDALAGLLHYLYSSILPRKRLPEAGCAWSSLNREDKLKYLHVYVELAQVAEQWLLEDLQEQCLHVVLDCLKKHRYLGPEVIMFAASCQQWRLVELAVDCIVQDYPRMRDNGDLDMLDEYLVDVIRAAHVRIFMSTKDG